jgi:predicted RNA-binding Zn-ribbon protein involved in translation (DUF1610 family)
MRKKTIKPDKKDTSITLRTRNVLLDELRRKTNQTQNSKAIDTAIKEYLEIKRDKKTNYTCYDCGETILKQELYYCKLQNLEMRDDEIITIRSEPTNILCMECAKKNPKTLEFIESKDGEEGDKVAVGER